MTRLKEMMLITGFSRRKAREICRIADMLSKDIKKQNRKDSQK